MEQLGKFCKLYRDFKSVASGIFCPVYCYFGYHCRNNFFLAVDHRLQNILGRKASGYLLLIFALAMTLFTGIKGVLDYSVLIASAGAFALSSIVKKDLVVDQALKKY